MKIMESEEIFNVIDVRQNNEYYHGFIPGSVNIPRGSIEFNIATESFWENEGLYMPEKKETLILYCKKGKRSTSLLKRCYRWAIKMYWLSKEVGKLGINIPGLLR